MGRMAPALSAPPASGPSPAPALDPEVLAATPLERLETEITALAAHLAAAECRWLVMLGEFDRREGYLVWGCRSSAHWLNWRCGISMRAAYERVRVGRALLSLPATRAAFGSGAVSYSKVRALTRVATPETERDLVDLAGSATAAQFERITGGVAAVARSVADEGRRAHHERALHASTRADGSGVITVQLPAASMALVMQALEAVAETMALADFVAEADQCSAEHSEEPSDPWSARMADAWCRMAEASLDPEAPERSFSERFVVNVHYDLTASLQGDDDEAHIVGGPALSSEVLERLLCDGAVVPVVEIEGSPVHTGRKRASVPTSMRRALRARDGGCRFPGCTNTRWVDAHHVVFQRDGGPTVLGNLILLCRFHHTSIHHRGFTIEVRDGGFIFRRSDGTLVPDCGPPLAARGPGIVEQNRQIGLDIGRETPVPVSTGDRLTRFGLDMAIDNLLARMRAPDPKAA